MKKVLLILCAALMLTVLLCSCMKDTVGELSDEVSTMMSEVKDDLGMDASNGTVENDSDGFIEDESDRLATTATTDDTDGIFDDNRDNDTEEYVEASDDDFV